MRQLLLLLFGTLSAQALKEVFMTSTSIQQLNARCQHNDEKTTVDCLVTGIEYCCNNNPISLRQEDCRLKSAQRICDTHGYGCSLEFDDNERESEAVSHAKMWWRNFGCLMEKGPNDVASRTVTMSTTIEVEAVTKVSMTRASLEKLNDSCVTKNKKTLFDCLAIGIESCCSGIEGKEYCRLRSAEKLCKLFGASCSVEFDNQVRDLDALLYVKFWMEKRGCSRKKDRNAASSSAVTTMSTTAEIQLHREFVMEKEALTTLSSYCHKEEDQSWEDDCLAAGIELCCDSPFSRPVNEICRLRSAERFCYLVTRNSCLFEFDRSDRIAEAVNHASVWMMKSYCQTLPPEKYVTLPTGTTEELSTSTQTTEAPTTKSTTERIVTTIESSTAQTTTSTTTEEEEASAEMSSVDSTTSVTTESPTTSTSTETTEAPVTNPKLTVVPPESTTEMTETPTTANGDGSVIGILPAEITVSDTTIVVSEEERAANINLPEAEGAKEKEVEEHDKFDDIYVILIVCVILLSLVFLIACFICIYGLFCKRKNIQSLAPAPTPAPKAPIPATILPAPTAPPAPVQIVPLSPASESLSAKYVPYLTRLSNPYVEEYVSDRNGEMKTAIGKSKKGSVSGKSKKSSSNKRQEFSWKDVAQDPNCPYALAQLVKKKDSSKKKRNNVETVLVKDLGKTQSLQELDAMSLNQTAKYEELHNRYRSKNSPDFCDARILAEITESNRKERTKSAGRTPMRRKKKTSAKKQKSEGSKQKKGST